MTFIVKICVYFCVIVGMGSNVGVNVCMMFTVIICVGLSMIAGMAVMLV